MSPLTDPSIGPLIGKFLASWNVKPLRGACTGTCLSVGSLASRLLFMTLRANLEQEKNFELRRLLDKAERGEASSSESDAEDSDAEVVCSECGAPGGDGWFFNVAPAPRVLCQDCYNGDPAAPVILSCF